MSASRRIYSELLPHDELVRPGVLALLRRYELDLVLAVRPTDLPGMPRVAAALERASVPLSLWPMLGDEDGRWASVRNAASFSAFARAALERASLGGRVSGLLVDLEPPFALVAALTGGPRRWLDLGLDRARPSFDEAEATLAALVAEVKARGLEASSAVVPLVVGDDARRAWQRALGTPALALDFDRVSVMAYTSLLRGWSRGVLPRAHVRVVLDHVARRSAARFGGRGDVSLGCVGPGALGSEPTYLAPGELADDVAIATAVGVSSLSLFDLTGVLRRPPPEQWLEAFVHGGPRQPLVASARVAFARAAVRGAGPWVAAAVEALSRA